MKRNMTAAIWGMMMVAIAAPLSSAQPRAVARNQPGVGGIVNLPYIINDSNGGVWRIYQGGWMQQQGNMPAYSQGAMLMINGQQAGQNNNQGKLDEKTGELVLSDVNANGLVVERRILFDKTNGFVRYIDVLRNPQNQPQTFNVMIQSSTNYGINAAQYVPDPKKKEQNIAWVAQTGAGVAVVEVFAGHNSKVVPSMTWPQGNNFVQASFSLAIPGGKEVAIMHLHRVAASADAGVQFITGLKDNVLLKSIPTALRKLIVNFPSGQGWIGDMEILRGDVLDVVELRGGDQFRGTIKESEFSLQTFYGPVSVPVDQVTGLFSIGQFRPHQLIITTDGQIFGGSLKKQTIDIQLSSGQVIPIPLTQISRAGYRKRAGEPDEWKFEKPMILLRSGERIAIRPPTADLNVATRYGSLALKPSMVAAIAFEGEESNVHQVYLTDGSKLSGLFLADSLEVTLDAGGQTVKLPASAIARLQLAPKVPEIEDAAPSLKISGDDQLIGMVTGKLGLDTAFDTITINAAEVKSITRAKESVQDVQVALWDGTTLSGQLHDSELACRLSSGVDLKVPLALLDRYTQPQPQPSAAMLDRIKTIVTDLNSDDWKARDRAQAALLSMGPVAEGVLKDLRDKQPAEAQKAIDLVIAKLEEQRKKDPSSVSATPNAGAFRIDD